MSSNISFISKVSGLSLDKEIVPQPAKKYYPSWWKDIPSKIKNNFGYTSHEDLLTVKACPSFVHWFDKGYVVPAWADITIKHDIEMDAASWSVGKPRPDNPYLIDIHEDAQMLDYVDVKFKGNTGSKIFKLVCPWQVVTPPGWSVFQFPMFYNFSNDWLTLPGIVDTDIWHEINQQIVYFGNGEEVFIPKGAPIAHYIPFQREENNLVVREQTEEDKKYFDSVNLKLMSKKRGGYFALHKEENNE